MLRISWVAKFTVIANLFIESKRAPGDDDDSDYYGDEEYDSNRDDNSNFAEKIYNM